MKSYFRIDKTASSALMFTAFSLLSAVFSATQAKAEVNLNNIAEIVPSTTVLSVNSASNYVDKNTNSLGIVSNITATPKALASNKTDSLIATEQPELLVADSGLDSESTELAPSQEESFPAANASEAEAEDPMGQLTNVSQLTDVRPGDWAYEALRELVERYGCIAGYPDGTFRGQRSLTRYEFAAGVNACLRQVEKLIAAGTADTATKADLDALRKLTDEFRAELATLGTKVDNLESRVGFLENHQFSTTTKLFGQAIVGLQGRSENDINLAGFEFEDRNTNFNLITNVQLTLFTQFSPRTVLLTGLQAGSGFTGGLTNFTALGYEGDTGNSLQLSDLSVRHLFGSKFAVIAGPEGVNPVNVFRGANRVESAGFGPISRFAQRNPIINIGGGRGGVGFDWQVLPRVSLQGVYSASRPSDASQGGIFGGENGGTTVGAQLNYSPTTTIDLAFDYLHSYSPNGFLGTGVGDDQLTLPTSLVPLRGPLKTNAFGATVEWRITPRFTIGGWGGYTTSEIPGESGNVETVNWMGFLNFPDLFGAGNIGGIYVGQPPKITSSDLPVGRNVPDFVNGSATGAEGSQPDSTLHLEAFYRWRLSDNISLTPGVIVIFNPNHNSDNDTITIGALRTTFSF